MLPRLHETSQKPNSAKARSPQAVTPAFTLVELLVVIGIIALLISILIPVLGKARQAAVQVQCMSNLRQFGNADAMYVSQYNWHMPAWWQFPNAYTSFKYYWAGLPEFRKAMALPIIPDPAGTKGYTAYVPRKWYCPNSQAGIAFAPDPGPDPQTQEVYYPLHYSYGMNVMGVDIPSALPPGMPSGPFTVTEAGSFPDVWDARATQADPRLPATSTNPAQRVIFRGFKPSQVRHPAEKIHFADALYFAINVYGCGSNTFASYPGWHNQKANYDLVGELPATTNGKNSQRSIAWRHNKGANVIFFDNHGEWMPKDKLYNRDASGNPIRNDRIWKVMD